MTTSHNRVEVARIIHTIHATTQIEACRQLYQNALGGLIFAEGYFEQEDRDMALLYVANHMIEPMAPRTPDDHTKPFARLTARIGQAFHSFELKVADGKAASARFREAGAVIASDYGYFFFVKAESTGGVLVEVCEIQMSNDPYDRPGWGPTSGTGHVSSVMALDHIACVTQDMASAIRFFTQVCDGEVVEDGPTLLPQPGRRVVIHLGDTRIAFIEPEDASSGPLGAFLAKPNCGIYALVWQVEDPARAKAHFTDKLQLRTTSEACVSPGFAIDPEDFFGARHEFIQASA